MNNSGIRLYFAAGTAVLLFCAGAGPSVAATDSKSFFDDFDSLASSRWYVSDGWANGAHQNCAWSKKEISASGGYLHVGFSKGPGADNRAYICGEVQTRTEFGYGTYEARYKTPAGSGLNGAFFTYIAPPKATSHDEIDFEGLLKDTSKVQTGGFANNKGVKSQTPDLPKPSDSDFINYAFVWAPGKLDYYVDGKLVHSVSDPALVQTQPQRIYFSLWGSETLIDWMGPFAEPAGPLDMQVDWVAYTAPGDRCLFPQSITCSQ